MAIRTTPQRKCGLCGNVVEARMIQSARLEWADLKTVVFAKTAPVFICGKCDGPGAAFPPVVQ